MSQMQSTPPLDPEPLPAELPKWPKVIGIISICWASIGMCCGVLGTGMGVFGRKMIPEAKTNEFPPQFVTPAVIIITLVGVAVGALLLVSGILTVSRKPAGRLLHIVYAVISILLAPISVYIGHQNQVAIMEWVQQNPGTEFAKSQQMGGGQMGQMLGTIFGLVIGLAYPLFVLVWFAIIKRKPDSMGIVTDDDVI